MKQLKIRDGSGFRAAYQRKAPVRVRWGLCPALPFRGSKGALKLMLGLTEDNAICRIAFMGGEDISAMGAKSAGAILKEWRQEWQGTDFVRDQKAVGAAAAKIFSTGALGKLHLTGTPFQLAVWKEMIKIPAGKIVSYGEMARRIKNPKAVRAVGSACGANPIPVLVPCHRVVASNGGLGGFGGGLKMKKALLKSEGVALGKNAA